MVDAIEFLKDVLANGPTPTTEIERRAREAGLLNAAQSISSSKLFKRAKQSLGIRSVRTGFGKAGEWCWVLDNRGEPEGDVRTAPTPKTISSPEGEPPSAAHQVRSGWAQALAVLDTQTPLQEIPVHRWAQFLDDSNHLLASDWGPRAAALGWDGLALFGCHRDRPLMYLGSAGLVWAINGGKVIKLERDWAVIELPDGSQRVFHRRRQDPAVVTLPWVGRRRPPSR